MTRRRLAERPRRFWTAAEDTVLRRRFPHEPTRAIAADLGRSLAATFNHAHGLGLAKSETHLRSMAARSQLRVVGVPHRFRKGQVPANKGLRRPGWAPGRMKETQFKRGVRQGIAAKLWKPIGTERLSKDGYLERKVNNDLPLQARWRAVHLVLWESVHGRLPKGYAIVFKNGDKTDIRLDNLDCITRAALMARNTVHRLPKPLALTVQLLGALQRQINRKDRHAAQKHDHPSAGSPVRNARSAPR